MKQDTLKVFNKYIITRDHYLKNAEKFLALEKFQKASEFLWGAVSQAIKAHALLMTGEIIKSHPRIKSYIRELSREKNDENLLKDFEFLSKLHNNFYDEEIDGQDFPLYYKTVKSFIETLEKYS